MNTYNPILKLCRFAHVTGMCTLFRYDGYDHRRSEYDDRSSVHSQSRGTTPGIESSAYVFSADLTTISGSRLVTTPMLRIFPNRSFVTGVTGTCIFSWLFLQPKNEVRHMYNAITHSLPVGLSTPMLYAGLLCIMSCSFFRIPVASRFASNWNSMCGLSRGLQRVLILWTITFLFRESSLESSNMKSNL